VFRAIKIPVDRWHSRLGHPSRDIMRRVISKNTLPCATIDRSNSSVCVMLVLVLRHMNCHINCPPVLLLPFCNLFSLMSEVMLLSPLVEKGTMSPLLMTIVSLHGYTYSIINPKSIGIFFEFQALIESLFNRKIISIQSNWDGEYEHLNSLFRKVSIAHQVSCPHPHQQNRAAERKHHHIVEMDLALLAHASMPLKYWDEAFLAATYLINRTPTKLLSRDTPLHHLLGATPDYSSFCVFGCAC
jgi:hypothetical protein